jgi:hypothetical protein
LALARVPVAVFRLQVPHAQPGLFVARPLVPARGGLGGHPAGQQAGRLPR